MVRIPEKYFWPGLVIAFLSFSVIWWTSMFFVAKSDGGPRVVEDYYQQAVEFDETKAQREAAARTGWDVAIDWRARDDRGVQVTVLGPDGTPVEGLEGRVELRRPELPKAVGQAELKPAGAPGRYAVAVQPDRKGLWDLVIEAQRDGQVYLFELREEVSL